MNRLVVPAGGGGSTTIDPYDTYADLPSTAKKDDLATVRTATGVWPINRKPRGVYLYDGASWVTGETPPSVSTRISSLESAQMVQAEQAQIDATHTYFLLNGSTKWQINKVDRATNARTKATPTTNSTYPDNDGANAFNNRLTLVYA